MSDAKQLETPNSTGTDWNGTGVASTSEIIRHAKLSGEDRSAGISLFVIFGGSFCIGLAVIGFAVLYVVCTSM